MATPGMSSSALALEIGACSARRPASSFGTPQALSFIFDGVVADAPAAVKTITTRIPTRRTAAARPLPLRRRPRTIPSHLHVLALRTLGIIRTTPGSVAAIVAPLFPSPHLSYPLYAMTPACQGEYRHLAGHP